MSSASKSSAFKSYSVNRAGVKRSSVADIQDARSSAAGSATSGIRVRKNIIAEKHKKRIMDVVNNLNEEELEKVSEMLRVSEAMDKGDKNAMFADEDDCEEADREQDEETVVASEAVDQVNDLHEVASGLKRATVHVPSDDQASSVSRQVSQSSKSAIASLAK